MSSQLVDINADGYNDILCGSFSGTPQIVMGSADGFEKPKDILDRDDELVLIEKFWNREDKKWDATDRCDSKGLCTSSSAIDWDADGDLDLILGAYRSGNIFLRINEGSATEPEFATENIAIKAGKGDMQVPKGLAAPCIVDWNDDGLFDIVCGGSKGGVYYFRNRGTKEKPKFASRQELIDPVDKKGSFVGLVPAYEDMPAMPGSSWHIAPVDYDGDGDLDLLVGARSAWTVEVPKLSDEQQQTVDDLSDQLKELRKQMDEMLEELDAEEKIAEIRKSKKYKKVALQYSRAIQERRKISNKADPKKTGDFVWLFRRK